MHLMHIMCSKNVILQYSKKKIANLNENFRQYWFRVSQSLRIKLCMGHKYDTTTLRGYEEATTKNWRYFLSASLYFSKRGAYWDRLCRDVVGRWSLVGWLVVTRVHCGQTVHPRPIDTMEH